MHILRLFIHQLLSHPVLKILSLSSIIFSLAYFFKVADNDLFARVAVGRLVIKDRAVPLKDIFAYSPTKDLWIDHEWLSGVIFYVLSQFAGDLALFLFTIFISILTIFFIILAQKALLADSKLGYALLFSALFPSSFIWNSVIRAHNFTFLFFSVYLWCLAKYLQKYSIKWLLIPVLLIVPWANLHGGFVVGLGMLSTVSLCLLLKRHYAALPAVICTLASTACTLLNPYGIDYLAFIFMAVNKSRPEISEWGSLTLSTEHLIFILFTILFVFCLCSKSRNKLNFELTSFCVVAWFFAVQHQRLVPFFLFCGCLTIPNALIAAINLSPKWLVLRVNALIEAVAILSWFALFVGLSSLAHFSSNIIHKDFRLDYSQYPEQALSWLVSNKCSGKLMVHFNQGSYALLYGYPDLKVSIDGRYEEVYSDLVFKQALAGLDPNDPYFLTSFKALEPDFILICRTLTDTNLSDKLPGKWTQLFVDDLNQCSVLSKYSENVNNMPCAKRENNMTVRQPIQNWRLRF